MSFCFFPFDRSFDFSAKLHKKNHYTLLYMQKVFISGRKIGIEGRWWSKEEARMAFPPGRLQTVKNQYIFAVFRYFSYFCTKYINKVDMEQILVTIDSEGQSLQKIRAAIKMLRGVVSTSVIKDPVLTKTEKQQAYVKESLTRAMQEVRLAKLNGQKLPDARDLLKELDEED